MPVPAYETQGSSGFDLRAAIGEPVVLEPGKRALISIGIKIALPDGYEAQIRPRSGLAYRHGITMLNSPGTIDSDYRGEIKVIVINHGENSFTINHGDRIAQMIIASVEKIEIQKVYELPKSKRGEGGFGSTGVS